MGDRNGVDLSAPLSRLWRDVYRKAGAVAEARAQELLKYHVYTYPHGAGGGGGGGGAMVLLERIEVLADGDPVVFSGIPGTYHQLQLVGQARYVYGGAGGRTGLYLRCNADGGTHYGDARISNDLAPGATTGYTDSYTYPNADGVPIAVVLGASASGPAATTVWATLPNYAGAYWKGVLSHYTAQLTATQGPWLGQRGGVWQSTSPITRLDVYVQGGLSLQAGSVFWLYAIGEGGGGGGGDGADVTITTDVSLTSSEAPANSFALAVRLSPDAGNALALHANGLYSTDTTGGGGGTGNTTMYTQTGTPTGATNSLWFNPSESA